MQTFIQYILLSTACLSVAWLLYKALVEKGTIVKTRRIYLIIAIVLSLAAPVSPLTINTPVFYSEWDNSSITEVGNNSTGEATGMQAADTKVLPTNKQSRTEWDAKGILFSIYLAVTAFFMIRIGRELYIIMACYRRSTKQRFGQLQIVWNDRFKASFSFFHLVFLNKKYLQENEFDKVVAHEKVHVLQYHSIDLLLVQLLTALMWFNPFVWKMRNALQLVHEYLADEGVLQSGIDIVEYQQSLLDHIAESQVFTISSTYKHSLIKKRFLMMSANKAAAVTKYRVLYLIPATAIMLLGVACVNGQAVSEAPKVVTAVALTKANVVYIGIENPVNISVSGYRPNDIEVAIDNGTISGDSGEYIIKPARPGKAQITVKAKGRVVQETAFKAKFLPAPVVALTPATGAATLIKGGHITKEALLTAGGIIATVENADIDIPIKVASFTLSLLTNGNTESKSAAAQTSSFSAEQVKLIQSLQDGQRIIIDDIAATGPDGKARKVPASMVFTIGK
ncbi:GldM family protein [Longitalea arenae]|uniref:GldM family protein n=1 Tax=Longitalea arenae TaxID=2812558 RepID=UPI0019670A34|nr:GldM family protein [Longitalea arenae]